MFFLLLLEGKQSVTCMNMCQLLHFRTFSSPVTLLNFELAFLGTQSLWTALLYPLSLQEWLFEGRLEKGTAGLRWEDEEDWGIRIKSIDEKTF